MGATAGLVTAVLVRLLGRVLPRAPATRELREWVRHRAKLVGLRSNMNCQVHAVLASAGVAVPMSDLFGQQGQQLLERVGLSVAARARVNSAQRIIAALDLEIDTFADLLDHRLHRDPGYAAIQPIRDGPCAPLLEVGSRRMSNLVDSCSHRPVACSASA